jgi:hypothetical protein
MSQTYLWAKAVKVQQRNNSTTGYADDRAPVLASQMDAQLRTFVRFLQAFYNDAQLPLFEQDDITVLPPTDSSSLGMPDYVDNMTVILADASRDTPTRPSGYEWYFPFVQYSEVVDRPAQQNPFRMCTAWEAVAFVYRLLLPRSKFPRFVPDDARFYPVFDAVRKASAGLRIDEVHRAATSVLGVQDGSGGSNDAAFTLRTLGTDLAHAMSSALSATRSSPLTTGTGLIIYRRDGRHFLRFFIDGHADMNPMPLYLNNRSPSDATVITEMEPFQLAAHIAFNLAAAVNTRLFITPSGNNLSNVRGSPTTFYHRGWNSSFFLRRFGFKVVAVRHLEMTGDGGKVLMEMEVEDDTDIKLVYGSPKIVTVTDRADADTELAAEINEGIDILVGTAQPVNILFLTKFESVMTRYPYSAA